MAEPRVHRGEPHQARPVSVILSERMVSKTQLLAGGTEGTLSSTKKSGIFYHPDRGVRECEKSTQQPGKEDLKAPLKIRGHIDGPS